MAKTLLTRQPSPTLLREIAGLRLRRHHLLGTTCCDPVTVARDICGVQAQVMSAAFLQFWARNHDVVRGQIEAALWQTRSLIKTSLMRQTLHLVPADEFPAYIAALRASRIAAVLRIMSRFKISGEEAGDLTGLILDALSSGPLGGAGIRSAVRPKVSRRIHAWMDRVWSIVRLPVAEGLICYGPGENNEATFIRVEQWLGQRMPAIPEEQARLELLRRYLRAYGPATLADFAHWSGMPASQARPLPGQLADELAEIEIGKKRCLLLHEDLEHLGRGKTQGGCVRLLPHFDPYLLAHREKDHLLEISHYKRVYRNQGWISPVVLVDGGISGVWSHQRQGRKLRITVEPFARLSRSARSAIADEAEKMAGFFGSALEFAIQ